MRRKLLFALAMVAVVIGAMVAAWLARGPEINDRDLSGLTGDINRGAYVARLAGCIACHTDTKKGGALMAGGAVIKTEFGSFNPPNVTPHKEDGIGNWSLGDFSKSLSAGKSPDGTHYFPSFPYEFYKNMTDQDVVDLWAAMNSVPPAAGKPPAHDMRFPFGFRPLVGIWQSLFFDGERLTPDKSQSDMWNRGRYLAEGPGHCGACHTPRNLLGGRIMSEQYAGGIGAGAEKIPAITVNNLKKNDWTPDDLAYGLKIGLKPDGDVFDGSMAEVVEDATGFWSDADLKAISAYLFSLESDK